MRTVSRDALRFLEKVTLERRLNVRFVVVLLRPLAATAASDDVEGDVAGDDAVEDGPDGLPDCAKSVSSPSGVKADADALSPVSGSVLLTSGCEDQKECLRLQS